MIEKTTKIISGIFAIVWSIVIFSEYWRYNPSYKNSIDFFQYGDLLLVFLLIGAGLSWGISKSKTKPIKFINGLTIFAGLLILDIITMLFFYDEIDSLNLTVAGLLAHLGHLVGVTSAVFLVYVTARTTGRIFTTVFPLKIAETDLPVIRTALGIMTLTLLLFFLGILGLLKIWIVAPLLLILLFANPHGTFQIVKKTLFQPLKITQKLNTLGIFSFMFLGAFLIFDFVQILRPFPIGSDSMKLYVNLPQIIGESGELVAGHQPYNWSLFMSLGTVVFGRIDVTLALSFLGSFLSFRALYRLSRKWLSVNQSAFCLLLFGSLPMVNFLMFLDVKIDLGLLFLMLCVLLVFYNQFSPPQKSPAKKSVKKSKFGFQSAKWLTAVKDFFAPRIPQFLKENHLVVIMGLLCGFGFGVKLTFLFFLLTMIAGMWYSEGGILAFTAAFFLIFGGVFLLKLDAQSHLRVFHTNIELLQWILIFIGVAMTAYLFFTQRKSTLNAMKHSLILGAFFLLPMLPWFGKNLSEVNKINLTNLLDGRKDTPEPHLRLKKMK